MNYSNYCGVGLSTPYFPFVSKISAKQNRNFQASNKVNQHRYGPKLIQNGVNPSTQGFKTSKIQSTTQFKAVNNYEKKDSNQNKTYDFKKRLYTSYSKFTEVKLITIGIASPLRILQWAEKTLPNGKIYGEVLNANTLHHKTFKPQKGGLFCERIFGPLKDFECSCGKIDKTAKYSFRETNRADVSSGFGESAEKNNKNVLQEQVVDGTVSEQNMKGKKSLSELAFGFNKDKMNEKPTRKLRKFCPDCDVEYTWSVIRRYQLGYIKLISPVTHVWFLKGTPSYLSILLDIKKRNLQSITYCSETFTIEHSDSAASALQTYKTSGFDLDSPSKIYASWSKAKNLGTILPVPAESGDLSSPSSEGNGNSKQIEEDKFLKSKKKRINIIQKWKSTIMNNIASKDIFRTDKDVYITSDLPPKEEPVRESVGNNLFSSNGVTVDNTFPESYVDSATGKSISDSSSFFSEKGTSRLISMLQLSLIYSDLVQSFYSNRTFNLQSFLIQKILYEKQGLLNTKDVESDDLSDFLISQNGTLVPADDNIHMYLPGQKPGEQAPYSDTEQVGPEYLIKKMNRKSDIKFYIKSSLQRILHKKIVMNSIIKTWQNLYKKAYLKAMYKTISYFLTVNSQQKNVTSNNFNLFFHYYKINRIYANKTSLDYLKKIIKMVKSYFKKNILLTLQNIKQPIFSTSVEMENYKRKETLPNHSMFTFYYTQIPIPYSMCQIIHKKSEQMIDFLSLDTLLLVDLLAENGFMAPLVVGKIFERSRYSSSLLLQNKSNLSDKNLPLVSVEKKDPNQVKSSEKPLFVNSRVVLRPKKYCFKQLNRFSLDYKIRLCSIAKNLLAVSNQSDTIEGPGLVREKMHKLSPLTVKKPLDHLSDGFETASQNQGFAFISPKLKIEFPQLLPFRLLKQPSLDLYSIKNGKYPINQKELNPYRHEFVRHDATGTSKKDELNVGKQTDKLSRPFLDYSMRELSDSKNFSPVLGEEYTTVYSASKNTQKKRLYNNVYTLSHRERWGSRVNEGKDWEIFLLYNTGAPKSIEASYRSSSYYKDQPIFAYKDRISSTAFNSQIYGSHISSTSEQTTSFSQNKKPYGVLINNSFFSGPGIVQQLLNELTFTEMKKLDKQNRLLLYILNKSIFRLKKHIKIFIYDKSSQIEMKELCKRRDLLIRRTKLVRKLFRKDSDPASMILTVLPVLPPDLRPIVKMGGQIAASDLNRFYQRVIYRNDRLKKFLKDPATSHSYEMKYAQRLLQEAVDNLIQNSQTTGEKDSRGRALKSLSDILKGKQGRFRQFLLGKRVDYSGRSVIVVGPKLKLYECGIPLEMALELYLPFLLKNILNKNYAKTVVGAKALIKNNRPLAFELLREIMQVSPVLLNRAPTLHRLGFQAFVPKLVEGRAILLHPLVCSSFNADFDGDQMAVHVPITIEARAEAWKLMLSRNNLLSPATGDPLSIPSQDMVLGCYYLTTNSNKSTLSLLRGSGLFFTDVEKVLYAYNLQKIDLHAIVWVKWSGLIENGNDQEEPIEIRLSSSGHWQELSYNYIRNFDSTSQLIHQYMATTPGRILFHSLLHSI